MWCIMLGLISKIFHSVFVRSSIKVLSDGTMINYDRKEWVKPLRKPGYGQCECGATWVQFALWSGEPGLIPKTLDSCHFCHKKETVKQDKVNAPAI